VATPILVLNCGSSSVKYQVIDIDSEAVLASGLVEKIGLPEGSIIHRTGDQEYRVDEPIPDHTAALNLVIRAFAEYGPPLDDVVAVAHRTVHGGWLFNQTVVITPEVIRGMEDVSELAPLHNPAGLAGIRAAQQALPNVPHVAIFDTAFFASMPPEAYTYAIDRQVAEKYHLRKYGFHGTSHRYVSGKVAQFLGRDITSFNQIVCHLGNGASISAIQGGQPIDTSMGMTPLAGLVMGTRSGDVDPAVFAHLYNVAGMDTCATDNLLNKRSGLAGLADGTSDFRDLHAKIDAGDPQAQLAFDVYIHRLVFYLGAYMALLGHTDTITFTAGVGENDPTVRAAAIGRLTGCGVKIDPISNLIRSRDARVISAADSTALVLVVPTNEELAMAREAYRVIG